MWAFLVARRYRCGGGKNSGSAWFWEMIGDDWFMLDPSRWARMDVCFLPIQQHHPNFMWNLIDGLKFETITGKSFFQSDNNLIRMRQCNKIDFSYLDWVDIIGWYTLLQLCSHVGSNSWISFISVIFHSCNQQLTHCCLYLIILKPI